MSFANRHGSAALAFKGGSTNSRLHLVRAKDASGHPAYYFLDVPPLQSQLLVQNLKGSGALDLREFGEIVASGYGDDVPQDVLDRMREDYGWAA